MKEQVKEFLFLLCMAAFCYMGWWLCEDGYFEPPQDVCAAEAEYGQNTRF